MHADLDGPSSIGPHLNPVLRKPCAGQCCRHENLPLITLSTSPLPSHPHALTAGPAALQYRRRPHRPGHRGVQGVRGAVCGPGDTAAGAPAQRPPPRTPGPCGSAQACRAGLGAAQLPSDWCVPGLKLCDD